MATARRSYHPGDVIYVGKPFVHVHPRSIQGTMCENCSAKQDLKFCTECRIIKYCSKKCQRNDWKDHKLECPYLKNLGDSDGGNVVHLLGKLILKIKGHSWKTITENVNGSSVSFADIISNSEEAKKDPRVMLFYNEIKAKLKKFIGKKNLPSDEELFKIIGKVRYNNYRFGGKDTDKSSETWAFYIGSSKFDNACIPNGRFDFEGKTMIIRATKQISVADRINVPCFPLVCTFGAAQKPANVRKSFLGPCKCNDCSLPYGTSVLTKIIDETNAHSIIQESEETISMLEATLPFGIKLPIQDHIKDLMKRQKDVLGDTNLLRMRLLALKCMHLKGPLEEVREELKQLAYYMRLAFGEYYVELDIVYSYLADCNMKLGHVEESMYYARKVASAHGRRIGFIPPPDLMNLFIFSEIFKFTFAQTFNDLIDDD